MGHKFKHDSTKYKNVASKRQLPGELLPRRLAGRGVSTLMSRLIQAAVLGRYEQTIKVGLEAVMVRLMAGTGGKKPGVVGRGRA